MDPRVTQQTRIRWSDIHNVEGGVKGLGTNLDGDVHLPMHPSFRTIESPYYNVAELQGQTFAV